MSVRVRHDGLWSLSVVMSPALRDALRAWQLETRAITGSVYSAATIALVQVRAALADAGIDTPPIEARRAAVPVLDSAAQWAHSQAMGGPRALISRLSVAMEPQRFAWLMAASRRLGYRSPQAAIVALVLSRLDMPLPACLAAGRIRRPSRAARAERVRGGAVNGGVDHVAAHLVLCRERQARDAWLLRGGRGAAPPSTVDDHLGRAVHRCDPRARVAVDRLRVREEDGGLRQSVGTSGMTRTYDAIGRPRYSWR